MYYKCNPGNSTRAILTKCSVKKSGRIGTDLFDISMELNIVKPVTELFFHVEVFFKYNTFKKFPVDLWMNGCRWLDGSETYKFIDWLVGNLKKHIKYGDKLLCPFKEGNLTLNMRNVSLNEQLPFFQLLPSGQYLTNTLFTEGNRSNVITTTQTLVKFLDNRIEQY